MMTLANNSTPHLIVSTHHVGVFVATADFFRHAIKDPDDAAAQTLGRMMSKDYGRHEPSHTEHHLWRNSPPSSSSHIIKAEIKDDASLQQDKLKFTCCDESKDVCKP